jgi:hypothetical protein
MINDFKTRTIESGGAPVDTAAYHINPENIVHITGILRNMYSDPVKAVVREYTSNAIDAHVMAGTDKQIVLHMPDVSEPWFSVRDFGGGLDKDETKELLYGFGSSGEHKRTSNTQIGGFGIGCKCAFAVSDNFTYTIWHNGTKRVWNCYLDESDVGKSDLFLEHEDATSLPGIEVRIPVKSDGFSRFAAAVEQVFKYLGVKPEITHDTWQTVSIPEPEEASFETTVSLQVNNRTEECTVRFTKVKLESPALILGGTRYDIDTNHIELGSRHDAALRNVLLHTMIVAPVGLVQLAPNRESIQYSPRTKKVLKALLDTVTGEECMKSLHDSITADKPNCATLVARLQILGIDKLPDNPWVRGLGYLSLKDPCDNHARLTSSWQGYDEKPRTFSDFSEGSVDKIELRDGDSRHVVILVPGAVPGQGGLSTLAYRLTYKFSQEDKLRELFDGKAEAYRYKRLVVHALPAYMESTVPWLTDGSILVFKADDLPSITNLDVDWHMARSNRGSSSYTKPARTNTTYSQHGKKFVRLKSRDQAYDSRRLSSMWDACTAKDTKDGVYVMIEKFLPCWPVSDGQVYHNKLTEFGASGMRQCFRTEQPLDILPKLQDGLLGIRDKDVGSIKDNDNFISLWDYIRDRFAEDVKTAGLDIDGFIMSAWMHGIMTRVEYGKLVQRFRNYVSGIVNADETDEGIRASAVKLNRDLNAGFSGVTMKWGKFIATLSAQMQSHPARLCKACGLDLSAGTRAEWWGSVKQHNPVAYATWEEVEKHETLKEVVAVLGANLPLVSAARIDDLFALDLNGVSRDSPYKNHLEHKLFPVISQVDKFLDMPETYSIMNRNKQEGDA